MASESAIAWALSDTIPVGWLTDADVVGWLTDAEGLLPDATVVGWLTDVEGLGFLGSGHVLA